MAKTKMGYIHLLKYLLNKTFLKQYDSTTIFSLGFDNNIHTLLYSVLRSKKTSPVTCSCPLLFVAVGCFASKTEREYYILKFAL